MPTEADIPQLIYCKTNIAGYFFDAVLRSEHTSNVAITEHPVESGANITDHSYVKPAQLVMEVGMSDVATSYIEGQFSGGWSRSVQAYKVLLELQQNRVPFSVLTRLKRYDNMLIETLAIPDDYTTRYGLKATATLREILVATVMTVKVSARPQVTDHTARGELQVEKLSEEEAKSLLNQLWGYLTS